MSCQVVVRRLLGFAVLGACAIAQADGHDWRDGHESRRAYGGEQRYGASDRWISALPPRHWVGNHRGSRYWFANGYWYAPYAGGYMVVNPPFGIVITDLPVFASIVTLGAVTYYVANDVYYRRVPEGYEVVERPGGIQSGPVAPSTPERRYVYPKLGQSAEKQAADEYDCHRWAVQQSGYDPTLALQAAPGAGVVSPAGSPDNYQQATQACLEGRGYSVK
ncbi:MAG: DUF6515 family protein [Leptothrix sp. (in: b-proteobacteria)]